jgi:hypothetical protein
MTREARRALSYQNPITFFHNCIDKLIYRIPYEFYGLTEEKIEILEK